MKTSKSMLSVMCCWCLCLSLCSFSLAENATNDKPVIEQPAVTQILSNQDKIALQEQNEKEEYDAKMLWYESNPKDVLSIESQVPEIMTREAMKAQANKLPVSKEETVKEVTVRAVTDRVTVEEVVPYYDLPRRASNTATVVDPPKAAGPANPEQEKIDYYNELHLSNEAAHGGSSIENWSDSQYTNGLTAEKAAAFGTNVYVPDGRDADHTFEVCIDSWASEGSWAVYSYVDGYITDTQYFSAGGECNSLTLNLAPGTYDVDSWDSYGDGGQDVYVDAVYVGSSSGTYSYITVELSDPEPTCSDIGLVVGGGSYDSEISWDLSDGSSGAAGTFALCLDDGDYTFNGYDSWGDGWNGASATFTDADGNTIASFAVEGSSGSWTFTVGGAPPVAGCTDPDAPNYNADAEVDDGTCEDYCGAVDYGCGWYLENYAGSYSCDDLYSYGYDCTLCEAAGECPVFGCTDSGADNYNDGADYDDGSCTYPCDGLLVDMYDAYGDGWNGNVLTIGDESFAITEYTDYAQGCYTGPSDVAVTCDGGSWQSEVSWTISDGDGNVLLSGGAPFDGCLGSCGDEGCAEGEYDCGEGNGGCIPGSWECDVYYCDCYDCVDESDCAAESCADTACGYYLNYGYTCEQLSGNYGYDCSACEAEGACDTGGSEACEDCEYDWTPYGSECCDTAWDEFGIDCATLESNYGWDCSGCGCPGDVPPEGCADGELTVDMADAYGDGWNGNVLTIGDESFTIDAGAAAQGCYGGPSDVVVTCDGGSWQSEVSWTISDGDGNVLLSGGAPFDGCLGECGGGGDPCADVPYPNWVSDGYCDSSNNVADCYDGGDCCESTCVDATYSCDSYGGCNGECLDPNGNDDACGGEETCADTACGYYLNYGYTCDQLSNNYGYDCSICEAEGACGDDTTGGSEACEDCEFDWTPYGAECCDAAWDSFGIDCATLEGVYGWDCAGCECPGDVPPEECADGEYSIVVDGGSWQSEISWSLDPSGLAGGAPYEGCHALEDGDYTLYMNDSYGDGWNGNTFDVSNADGLVATCTLDSGTEGTCAISLGDTVISGCTDPSAPEYNPDATLDDGSCWADCAGIINYISDGWCDSSNNNEGCGFDGGDCCPGDCVDSTYSCEQYGGDCTDCLDPNSADNQEGGQCEDYVITCGDTDCGNYIINYGYTCWEMISYGYDCSVCEDEGYDCSEPATCDDPDAYNYGGYGDCQYVPDGWTCPEGYAFDSWCDCGCGAYDETCDDPYASQWDNCGELGCVDPTSTDCNEATSWDASITGLTAEGTDYYGYPAVQWDWDDLGDGTSCEENGLVTCWDGSCASSEAECPVFSCDDGYVEDCADDDCCPEGWIGDGLCDGEDQQWGCDLTCYDNDGGDCDTGDDGGDTGGGDACADTGCGYWLNYGYTCEQLSDNYGYDCTACEEEGACPTAGSNEECAASFEFYGADPDGTYGSCWDDGSGYFYFSWEGGCVATAVTYGVDGEEPTTMDLSAYGFANGFFFYGFDPGSLVLASLTFTDVETETLDAVSECTTDCGDGNCNGTEDYYNCPEDCLPPGECAEGQVVDCADDDCCPESWIGDGYADCEDQAYGCDLTCYDNDGGDCDEATSCADTGCGYYLNYGYTCEQLTNNYGYDCSLCEEEGACGGDEGCAEGEYDCGEGNGGCIPGSWECDVYWCDCYDCVDESDCGGRSVPTAGSLSISNDMNVKVHAKEIGLHKAMMANMYRSDRAEEKVHLDDLNTSTPTILNIETGEIIPGSDPGNRDVTYTINVSCDACLSGGPWEGSWSALPQSDFLVYGFDAGSEACGNVTGVSSELGYTDPSEDACDNAGAEDECEFLDCEGQEACGYESWVGDGYCDDGSWGFYFNCAEFDCDAGDCLDECGECNGDGSSCACDAGDVNGDDEVNVQDIVLIVGYILDGGEIDQGCADANGDGTVNVQDIVVIVNQILGGRTTADATEAKLNIENGSVSFDANGFVGAVQITLSHGAGFTIKLTDKAMFADYRTNGNSTTLIVVAPESNELFEANDFTIKEAIFANEDSQATVAMPTELTLSKAYPNPFNPSTSFNVYVPAEGVVNMSVYNVMGQLVDVIHSGSMTEGSHKITWNAFDMTSGVYFVRAESINGTSVQKVMLMK